MRVLHKYLCKFEILHRKNKNVDCRQTGLIQAWEVSHYDLVVRGCDYDMENEIIEGKAENRY